MKTSLTKTIILLVVGFAVVILTSCNSSTEEPTPVMPTCKFKSSNTNESYQPQPAAGAGAMSSWANIELTNEFDSQGRLISSVQNSNHSATTRYTTTNSYTYDVDGFVISSRNEKITNLSAVTTSTYQYTNNRIATITAQTVGSGNITSSKTTTYEYDGGGNLTKITEEATPSGAKTVATYANGLLTNYTYKASSTAAEFQPFTIVNGLVTRSSYSTTSYTTYTYNNTSERLTKAETFTNGTLNSYYTYEYDEMSLPQQALPTFKGFPTIKAHNGKAGVQKKYEYYSVLTPNTTPVLMNQTTSVNQANGRGFVTSTVDTNNQYTVINSVPTITYITTSNRAYSYIDCN